MKLTKEQVAAVVTEASQKMADANYTAVMVGEFVQRQQPVAQFISAHERELGGGIMVTGSHNPADQNGFKLLAGTEPVFGAALRALVETAPVAAAGGLAEEVMVADAYVRRLLVAAAGAPPLRIGWDPGNGAAGDVLATLTAALPGEHRIIHGPIDGRFPAHHPDPSVAANLADLQALVVAQRLDDLAADRERRVERVQRVLQDRADVPASQRRAIARAQPADVVSGEAHAARPARRGRQQPHHGQRTDRLAATRFAHQGHGAVERQVERDALDGIDGVLLVRAEGHAQGTDFEQVVGHDMKLTSLSDRAHRAARRRTARTPSPGPPSRWRPLPVATTCRG